MILSILIKKEIYFPSFYLWVVTLPSPSPFPSILSPLQGAPIWRCTWALSRIGCSSPIVGRYNKHFIFSSALHAPERVMYRLLRDRVPSHIQPSLGWAGSITLRTLRPVLRRFRHFFSFSCAFRYQFYLFFLVLFCFFSFSTFKYMSTFFNTC